MPLTCRQIQTRSHNRLVQAPLRGQARINYHQVRGADRIPLAIAVATNAPETSALLAAVVTSKPPRPKILRPDQSQGQTQCT